MSRRGLVLLVLAAVVVIFGASYLSSRRDRPQRTEGTPLLPALAGQMNSVAAVSIRKGGPAPSVTLHKREEHWTVEQRHDYPADVSKLRKVLTSLADARIVEEKTSDPARYASIGVDDPSLPAATGTELTVTVADGQHTLIVGKPVGAGNFVRRAGEKRSYSIEPSVTLESEPRFWIDSRLIDVPTAQIQRIDVKPATGAAYALYRSKPTDSAFTLEGTPAGRQPLEAQALAPSATLLAALDAEDVSLATDIDFSHSSQARVSLAGGDVITLNGVVSAEHHWLEAKASKDAALNAKGEGRVFEVAGYRYDALFKPLEQLLVPKEAAASKTSSKIPRPPLP